LPFPIARLTQKVAQWVLDGCQARHAHSSREIRNAGQRDRAHARRFNCSLYQSHGPAADRSARDQQDDVHLIPLHVLDHRRHALLQKLLRLQDVAHNGVMVGGCSSNLTTRLQL
jgi:hypothetical protein